MSTSNRNDATYDVVIVGARVAGAATAHLLARFGLQVLLVDRGRYGSDTLSTHALMRGGVLQLSRWGLLDKIISAGTPAGPPDHFRYADAVVPITIKSSYGVDALYAPRRTVLDPILVDAAAAAGVDVRFGIAVTDVERDRQGDVTGIVGRTRDGQPLQVRARIVVGADGIRSTIAERVGAPFERVGTSVPPSPTATGRAWRPTATNGTSAPTPRPAWSRRTTARHACTPAPHPIASAEAAWSPLAGSSTSRPQTSPPGSPLATPPPALRTFTGRPGHVRRSWGHGWALVGDAGYFKDPLTAHGLTDALRDAELLARAIAAVIVDGADERDALAGYQRTRDALSAAFFDLTDVIAGHHWTDEEIPDLLLQLNAAMADEVEALAAFSPLPSPSPQQQSQASGPTPRPLISLDFESCGRGHGSGPPGAGNPDALRLHDPPGMRPVASWR